MDIQPKSRISVANSTFCGFRKYGRASSDFWRIFGWAIDGYSLHVWNQDFYHLVRFFLIRWPWVLPRLVNDGIYDFVRLCTSIQFIYVHNSDDTDMQICRYASFVFSGWVGFLCIQGYTLSMPPAHDAIVQSESIYTRRIYVGILHIYTKHVYRCNAGGHIASIVGRRHGRTHNDPMYCMTDHHESVQYLHPSSPLECLHI